MTRIHLPGRARAGLLSLTGAATAALALHAGPAAASTNQVSLIQDGVALNQNPYSDLARMKQVGANTVRVMLNWDTVAPSAHSKRAPRFKASDPGAYPADGWGQWDAIVNAAHVEGIRVDLDIIGAPPRWAEARNVPSHYLRSDYGWEPNAGDYGQFVRAVATRYSGHFKPAGASTPLPKVVALLAVERAQQRPGPRAAEHRRHQEVRRLPAGAALLPRDAAHGLRRAPAHRQGRDHPVRRVRAQGKGPYHTTRRLPFGLPGQVSLSAPETYVRTLMPELQLPPAHRQAAAIAGCPTNGGRVAGPS